MKFPQIDPHPFANPFEGRFQSVMVIYILGHGKGSCAKTTLVPGVIWVTFDFYEFVVFYMGKNAAAAMASRACRPGGCFNDSCFSHLLIPDG